MTSVYCYDHNLLWFCFLVQIRAFVFYNSMGLQNEKLKYERKNEKDSGRSSKIMPSCKRPICAGSAYFILFQPRGGGRGADSSTST